ncbi:50S ribosomal protein L18 [candidate division WWE3 bacterium]|nr:50S ribosomal protein L18 [candidate division WWE3 bacterium]
MKVKVYKSNKLRRRVRVRSKMKGTQKAPRLSVFRSNKHIYALLIDGGQGKVLASASDLTMKSGKGSKTAKAKEVGKRLAEEASKKGVKSVVFDRGSYKYHGRVKAVAEGAREGGLKF